MRRSPCNRFGSDATLKPPKQCSGILKSMLQQHLDVQKIDDGHVILGNTNLAPLRKIKPPICEEPVQMHEAH